MLLNGKTAIDGFAGSSSICSLAEAEEVVTLVSASPLALTE